MIREVNLVSYLPQFMQSYTEPIAALEAENPEFILVWKAADRTLKNEFIETADKSGIERFERILGITASKEETLDLRRKRLQSLWFNTIPYTYRFLLERLTALCGEYDFTVTKHFFTYRIDIETHLEELGFVEELDRLLDMIIPCNMLTVSYNQIVCQTEGQCYIGGCVGSVEHFVISSIETD